MSETTATTSVPQAPITVSLEDIPWFNTGTPEHRDAVAADWAKCQANMSLAEYVKDASEGWSTAEAYLKDAGWKPNPVVAAAVDAAAEEPVPEKAAEVYVKYVGAVEVYAVATTKGHLDIGRWGHAYILAVTKGETDAGVRKSKRASAVKRLDGALADAGIHPANCEHSIRLWSVASVFGKTEARKLGVGKLRAFEQCLYRDKETEAWGMKDTVTAEQDALVRDLFARAAAGSLDCNAEVLYAEVRKALGKPVVERPADTAKPDAPAPEAPKPAVVSHSTNPAPAGHVPEVAPENPVECAKRMASLPYGRPDSALVWRSLGIESRMSEADAQEFVAGLCDNGQLAALTAIAKAAVAAIAKLQAESKTAEQSRTTAAPVMTKPAPIAVPTGPGGTTGVTVVAGMAA
jgi:hypothetical protein